MRKKVGIIFGGKSGEYAVSLKSAYNVIKAIDKNKYELTLIGINTSGQWKLYNGDIENIINDTWQNDESCVNMNLSLFNDPVIDDIDIFFPVLHGTFGEDGTIQGLFEMLNKPYIGCAVTASAVCMDKIISKHICKSVGIPITDYCEFDEESYKKDTVDIINKCCNMGFPLFVKPANLGSSVGITKACDNTSLLKAIDEALKYDNRIIIEKAVDGAEIEVAVLGNEDAKASVCGMIKPCKEFYDYEAKYLSGNKSETIIPAPIDDEISEKIRKLAVKAFKAHNCSGLSRVDFFLEKNTNRIILNELNTLPGFTDISMYAMLWAQSGISYVDLIDDLIALGFDRYDKRSRLSFKKL